MIVEIPSSHDRPAARRARRRAAIAAALPLAVGGAVAVDAMTASAAPHQAPVTHTASPAAMPTATPCPTPRPFDDGADATARHTVGDARQSSALQPPRGHGDGVPLAVDADAGGSEGVTVEHRHALRAALYRHPRSATVVVSDWAVCSRWTRPRPLSSNGSATNRSPMPAIWPVTTESSPRCATTAASERTRGCATGSASATTASIRMRRGAPRCWSPATGRLRSQLLGLLAVVSASASRRWPSGMARRPAASAPRLARAPRSSSRSQTASTSVPQLGRRRRRRARIPVDPALSRRGRGWLGPAIVPGATPCYRISSPAGWRPLRASTCSTR